MKSASSIWLFVLALAVPSFAAPAAGARLSPQEQWFGTWTGKWDSAEAGSGGFEIVLEKGKDTAVAGRVSVTGEVAYKADLKTAAFDGPRMTATYDFPPDENVEVVLTATFDEAAATGTWTAREKASGTEAAKGTWNVARK